MPTSPRQIGPIFRGIFGEFDGSQWVDVGIDPYGENGRPIKIYKPAI